MYTHCLKFLIKWICHSSSNQCILSELLLLISTNKGNTQAYSNGIWLTFRSNYRLSMLRESTLSGNNIQNEARTCSLFRFAIMGFANIWNAHPKKFGAGSRYWYGFVFYWSKRSRLIDYLFLSSVLGLFISMPEFSFNIKSKNCTSQHSKFTLRTGASDWWASHSVMRLSFRPNYNVYVMQILAPTHLQ